MNCQQGKGKGVKKGKKAEDGLKLVSA